MGMNLAIWRTGTVDRQLREAHFESEPGRQCYSLGMVPRLLVQHSTALVVTRLQQVGGFDACERMTEESVKQGVMTLLGGYGNHLKRNFQVPELPLVKIETD
jgi:hypothetical protein